MILVDFDRTLFDTDGFYDAIYQMLHPRIESLNSWNAMYNSYQDAHSTMDLFEALRAHGIDTQHVNEAQEKARAIAPSFLYSDALKFLNFLASTGQAYTIFTYGDPSFQQFKLGATGLDAHPHVIATEPKHHHEMLKAAKVFIDDSPNEIAHVHEAAPTLDLFRMRRPMTKYADIVLADHTSLTTIENLLDQRLLNRLTPELAP